MNRNLGERNDPAFPVTGFHAGLLYQALSLEKCVRGTPIESDVNLVVKRAGSGTLEFDQHVLDIIFKARVFKSIGYCLPETVGNRVKADSLMLVINTKRIGKAKTLARQVADVLSDKATASMP